MKRAFGLLLCALLASPLHAAPLPQPEQDYAADFILTVSHDAGRAPMKIPGRIYFSAGKERRESRMMGRTSVSIRRPQENLFWVLMPERRMYLESSGADIDKQKDPSDPMLDGDFQLEKIGTEKLNGVATDKYRFSSVDKRGNQTSGYIWLTRENIPLKMEGSTSQQGRSSRFASELSNLELASQPAELFEIPAGYQKLQTPSMVGGMGNLQGNSTMLPDAPAAPDGGMGMSPEDLKKLQQQLEQFQKQMQQQ